VTNPAVDADLATPDSTERAIRGTFTIEVATPEWALPNTSDANRLLSAEFGLTLPLFQALTFSPRDRRFEVRDQPHRGLMQKAVSGFSVKGYPHHFHRIIVSGLGGLVVGLPLTYLDEHGDRKGWGEIRRAWMIPESPKPTISKHGEAVVWDDSSFTSWHLERLGVQ